MWNFTSVSVSAHYLHHRGRSVAISRSAGRRCDTEILLQIRISVSEEGKNIPAKAKKKIRPGSWALLLNTRRWRGFSSSRLDKWRQRWLNICKSKRQYWTDQSRSLWVTQIQRAHTFLCRCTSGSEGFKQRRRCKSYFLQILPDVIFLLKYFFLV